MSYRKQKKTMLPRTQGGRPLTDQEENSDIMGMLAQAGSTSVWGKAIALSESVWRSQLLGTSRSMLLQIWAQPMPQ